VIGIPTLKLHGHYLVMATLGFNLIANIIIIQWDVVTGGPSGFPGIPNLSIGQWALDTDRRMYYFIWLMVFLAIVLALNLVNSRAGRGLRALHGSEVAAASLGVKTKRYKVKIFVLSAVYASFAGSVYAHYLTFISPKTFDIFFSVELVTMVIVGGMGSIWGVLFGTIFLTSLPNVLHLFDEYKDIFYGLILVVILIFLPEGVVVAIRRHWLTRRRAQEAGGAVELAGERRPSGTAVELFRPLSVKPAARATTLREPILRVNNVSIRFGGLMALVQVSFEVPRGEVTSLIGPNGAGKTTMINVISGTYKPQSGEIFFEGGEITNQPPYRMAEMGLTRTFQNIQVFENMTVLENVMVGLHAQTGNEFVHSMFHLPGFRSEENRIEQRAW
ncbi:MAG: ATP-binding cassette domain-containing protein, partial [Deltaproteobacteria bacterium]|nr:ATP-binding cassette domain-containing protein [Deltaproteobacteria bacterium]